MAPLDHRRLLIALRTAIGVAATLALVTIAQAATIAVDPVRIELSSETPSATLTIHNSGAEAVVVQAEVLAWTQPDGRDQYAKTRDVLVTPAVATVPARSDQIVRVALRGRAAGNEELAYRLYIQEVPSAARAGAIGLNVTLRIGVPVFIAPRSEPVSPDIAWQITRTGNEAVQLIAANRGARSVRLSTMQLVDATGRTLVDMPDLAYVLAGRSRSWPLHNLPQTAGPLRLRAETHAGAIDAPVQIP